MLRVDSPKRNKTLVSEQADCFPRGANMARQHMSMKLVTSEDTDFDSYDFNDKYILWLSPK